MCISQAVHMCARFKLYKTVVKKKKFVTLASVYKPQSVTKLKCKETFGSYIAG